MKFIYPNDILTVIIRDDCDMVMCGDSPKYRSIQIKLTNEQISKIKLYQTYSCGEKEYHECISSCFLEPKIDSYE